MSDEFLQADDEAMAEEGGDEFEYVELEDTDEDDFGRSVGGTREQQPAASADDDLPEVRFEPAQLADYCVRLVRQVSKTYESDDFVLDERRLRTIPEPANFTDMDALRWFESAVLAASPIVTDLNEFTENVGRSQETVSTALAVALTLDHFELTSANWRLLCKLFGVDMACIEAMTKIFADNQTQGPAFYTITCMLLPHEVAGSAALVRLFVLDRLPVERIRSITPTSFETPPELETMIDATVKDLLTEKARVDAESTELAQADRELNDFMEHARVDIEAMCAQLQRLSAEFRQIPSIREQLETRARQVEAMKAMTIDELIANGLSDTVAPSQEDCQVLSLERDEISRGTEIRRGMLDGWKTLTPDEWPALNSLVLARACGDDSAPASQSDARFALARVQSIDQTTGNVTVVPVKSARSTTSGAMEHVPASPEEEGETEETYECPRSWLAWNEPRRPSGGVCRWERRRCVARVAHPGHIAGPARPADAKPHWYAGYVGTMPGPQNGFTFLVLFDDDFETTVDPNDLRLCVEDACSANAQLKDYFAQTAVASTFRRSVLTAYFARYPEWPRVRVPRNVDMRRGCVRWKISYRDGHEYSALVLTEQKDICTLRLSSNAGIINDPHSNCTTLPCRAPTHKHTDLRLYRGSIFLSIVRNEICTNKGVADMLGLPWNNPSAGSRRMGYGSSSHALMRTRQPSHECDGIQSGGGAKLTFDQGRNRAITEYRARKSTTRRGAGRSSGIDTSFNRIEPNLSLAAGVSERELQELIAKEARCEYQYDRDVREREGSNPIAYDALVGRPPLAIPLIYGFGRQVYTTSKRRRPKHVLYQAPCGRVLRSMHDVRIFLTNTQCDIPFDCFSFDAEPNCARTAVTPGVRVVSTDVTGGAEQIPIPAVNAVDADQLPVDFGYVPRRFRYHDGVDMSTVSPEFCSGCSCTDNCANPAVCECAQLTVNSVMRLNRSLRPTNGMRNYKDRRLPCNILSGVFECNANCPCSMLRCPQRVVQQPIKFPLQLFKTADRGWGVRALSDIPRGSFVATYSGAVLTDEVADKLGADMYFAELDLIAMVENGKDENGVDLIDGAGIVSDEEDENFTGDEDGDANDDGRCSPTRTTESGGGDDDEGVVDMGPRGDGDDDGIQPRRSKRLCVRKAPPPPPPSSSSEQRSNQEREAANRQRAEKFDLFEHFGDGKSLYIVDADSRGNVGRYLNHSCDPNCFTQLVFVDTHDLRLPWVAFFAYRNIQAGEELTWNYGYESPKDTNSEIRLMCRCRSKNCVGRLL